MYPLLWYDSHGYKQIAPQSAYPASLVMLKFDPCPFPAMVQQNDGSDLGPDTPLPAELSLHAATFYSLPLTPRHKQLTQRLVTTLPI